MANVSRVINHLEEEIKKAQSWADLEKSETYLPGIIRMSNEQIDSVAGDFIEELKTAIKILSDVSRVSYKIPFAIEVLSEELDDIADLNRWLKKKRIEPEIPRHHLRETTRQIHELKNAIKILKGESPMNEPIHIVECTDEQSNKLRLIISYDTDAESPRTDDNLGTIILANKIKHLGDDHKYSDDQILERMNEKPKYIYRMIVRKYEHGNILLSTSDKYPFDCPWDAGIAGYIEASWLDINIWLQNFDYQKNVSVERIKWTVAQIFESELKTLSQWINGEVYQFSYEIEDPSGAIIEDGGCSGFYDIEDMTCMLPDLLVEKMRSEKIIN